jgi:hypothetical protein
MSPSSTSLDWEYFSHFSSIPVNDTATPSCKSLIIDDIVTFSTSIPHDTPPSSPISPIIHRHSTRNTTAPSYLKDYICNNIHASTYPISHYISHHQLSNKHSSFVMSLQSQPEPKSYAEASKLDCWKHAMQVELQALEKTGTWKLVDLPPNVKPIGCRWIYKVKFHNDGTIERYKARLVAKGYNKIEGLDYLNTYSPVAKLTTVRLVIALSSIHNWHLHQLDVKNAFLHGELQEDLYMLIPPSIKTIKPNQVCKLQKSLYGLKQASRKWYERLTSTCLAQEYLQAASDHSLFVKKTSSSFTILLVYVDDIILAGNSISEFDHIKSVLDSLLKIKDLGQLKYFLGIEVAHSKLGISLCQRKYCLDLLADSGTVGSKPISTPSNSIMIQVLLLMILLLIGDLWADFFTLTLPDLT